MGSPSQAGGPARTTRHWIAPGLAVGVVLLFLVSGLFVAVAPASAPASAHGPSSAPAPVASPRAAVSPAIVTHGDLVVSAGQTYTIEPLNGSNRSAVYYQGGNITVLPGGTLNVTDVNLTFVQFVSDVGTPMQRLSHIYKFTDAGTVNFNNANLTTDLGVINAWAKLNVSVTGQMNLWDSQLRFPGWVTVSGASAELTLNNSSLTANPAVTGLLGLEPSAIWGDTDYAASLVVTGGAKLNLFGSSLNNTYADNTAAYGIPGPAPLTATNVPVQGGGTTITQFATPTDSANLSLDYLYYPVGIAGGNVQVFYNNTNALPSTTNVTATYAGTGYPLGPLFLNNATSQQATIAFTPALTAAISNLGLLAFLNNTGDFGLPSHIGLTFSAPAGGDVLLSTVAIVVTPPLQYNMVASGAGTTVSSVDSRLDLSFYNLPANPVSQVYPYPWASNKFWFTGGAVGYLGNLSVTGRIPGVYSTSAILTDAASTVYLFRWADFNLTGSVFKSSIEGVAVSSFYAYNNDQTSNATVNALNAFKTSNAAIWGYLVFWDFEHGASSYGVSNSSGHASVLLASSEITNGSLPSGIFLGGYHIGLTVPSATTGAQWLTFAVKPYPTGVANGTAGWGTADMLNVSVILAPPVVRIVSISSPPSTLNLNDLYASTGILYINGPGHATLIVTALPVGGGNPVVLAESSTLSNGTFDIQWIALSGALQPGATYTLNATAGYQGSISAVTLPGTYYVPSTTSTSGFLFQTFLGLPLWLWLAIAAAAIVAICVVLLLFRRQAAGKLVECGECGELIPEDATVCPKCGAEFETDLVRCSRCSSTIPADSQFCPECSAQLLGKPGEGESDPERQAYADFTEKFRADAKKELGENYTESSFWDWWKRQPTYVPFSQWKVQQTKGTPRAGMSEPPVGSQVATDAPPLAPGQAPPKGGAAVPPPAAAAPGAGPGFTAPPKAAAAPVTASGGALKPCPNCGKEIPPEYLVCPFCGAVTQ
jgi:RNA polymerase subunit RPABC4/transcription elongation factor Spt4